MATELVALALQHARTSGLHATPLAALQIIRTDHMLPGLHSMLRPSLCFIAQGAKQVAVGSTVFKYARNEFLFSSVDLPVTGQVTDATPRAPYLCLMLEISPSLVFELVTAMDGVVPPRPAPARRAIFVGKQDDVMADAFLRLMRCAQSELDARVLAPSVIREITYRLLCGPYGNAVRDLGVAGSQTQRVAAAIDWLKRDYAKPLRVAKLARLAGMSSSAFHQHFKQVTTLSPLQYQKQLRLQEARRLLLDLSMGAADVGFRVGYESPSQFSREYTRLFGLPPISDAKRIRSAPTGEARGA